MILSRLTITNFGVYRGRHEFELRPLHNNEAHRPVILFGGKNGAGKTTILEAIRLCLYGRGALGNRVRQADYDTYIRQRMHRSPVHQIATFTTSVGLLFDHVHAGVRSTYDAVRSWHAEANGVDERVTIYKDGKPLEEIAPEHWSDFLRDLIPPGVSELFFFDGEQLQALADSDREPETLAAAVRGLLNLDLIDRLRSDLSIYLRQQDEHDRSRLRQEAEQADALHKALENRSLELQQDRAQLVTRMEWLNMQLERMRQQLVGEGANLVYQRDALERQQKEVEAQIEQVSTALRELAASLLPFAVTPLWCNHVRTQLLREETASREQLAYTAQQEQAATVALHLLDPSFQRTTAPELDQMAWARLTTAIQTLLTPSAQPEPVELRHGLSDKERETLLGWIDTATNAVPAQLHSLGHRLEALEAERSQLEQARKQVPSDEIALPLLEDFNRHAEEKGRVHEQLTQLNNELHQIDLQLAQRERERKQAWLRLAEAGDTDARVERAAKAQVVLEQYRERITALKIEELEQAIAHYFNLLCRKRILVREVRIDRKRFTVELFGPNRMVLPKSDLSAGEKQLYATALLWALRSVSGRALPIIVDTPMGRLDSTHRKALLNHFFPHASHQVLVLSTDTEITPEAYTQLEPAIAHTFHLEYDEEDGCTSVQRGYFDILLEEVAA
ncbi:DNA sulfur modification protein DndD [Candidatus Chloroploca sp. Khr17]|uniref:DNA sulfur modification protein DndD n=1 Tax=Candidatus Chloroploca sp. Khr17 TaxID=2496869 RepID=UPI00101D8442|nr:DNA sulfur modification protein DndD [Candidatus Chloroploca sp. Khr17]